ncbi:MAG: asparagine synthase-related protein, partial [Rubripirellula sp.]|nr:asparagine synthase-related protein [Rubripirellula sp.]
LRWMAARLRKGEDSAPFFPTFGDWYRHKYMKFKQAELERVFLDLPAWPDDCRDFRFSASDQRQAAGFVRWSGYRTGLQMINLKVDRASMHHSLEVRVPLLDREVIDVARRVRWDSCLDVKQRVGKKPLRAALAKRSDFQSMTKRGFSVGMDRWLRTSLKERLEDLVLDRDEFLGFPINRDEVVSMCSEHFSGQKSHAQALWTLLSLALWIERHYDNRHSMTHGTIRGERSDSRD